MLLSFPRLSQSFGYGNNVIDFGYWPNTFVPPPPGNNPYAQFILLTRWNTLDFNASDNFNFVVSQVGGAAGGSSIGPLILDMSGNSNTVGTVLSYNDGIINVTSFGVSYLDPIVEACRRILTQTGITGRTYKLAVRKGGVVLFTVRSVYWGTKTVVDPPNGDYQAIDHQSLDSTKTVT